MTKTILIIIAAILSAWPATSAANPDASKSPYTVSATATAVAAADGRPAQQTMIKIAILKQPKNAAAEPEVLSRPAILVVDGQQARIVIGQTKATTRRSNDPTSSSDPFTGIRIDVVKPREQAEAIVVTTIWDDGNISWAQTDAVKVVAAAAKPDPRSK